MNYVTLKWKHRFVHRNDPPDPLGLVKCGAWTWKNYPQGTFRDASDLEIISPADVWHYHKCKKCFPPTPTP